MSVFKGNSHVVSGAIFAVMVVGWIVMLSIGVTVPDTYIQFMYAVGGSFVTLTGAKAVSTTGASNTPSNPQLGS